jgi:hypothetical protein
MFQFIVGVCIGILLVFTGVVPMQKSFVDEVIEKIKE